MLFYVFLRRVEALLKDHPERAFFFAIGAGHFLGEQSLLGQLRQLGWNWNWITLLNLGYWVTPISATATDHYGIQQHPPATHQNHKQPEGILLFPVSRAAGGLPLPRVGIQLRELPALRSAASSIGYRGILVSVLGILWFESLPKIPKIMGLFLFYFWGVCKRFLSPKMRACLHQNTCYFILGTAAAADCTGRCNFGHSFDMKKLKYQSYTRTTGISSWFNSILLFMGSQINIFCANFDV